jgi:indole-3-glycerol phosphate synthase
LNHDYLDKLSENAFSLIDKGYYSSEGFLEHNTKNLDIIIRDSSSNPIIAELKFASPSAGKIRQGNDSIQFAKEMINGKAVALSILTEPNFFGGSISNLVQVRRKVNVPILMKDFFVSKIQIDTAKKLGADVILLIMGLFAKNKCDSDLDNMISYAHSLDLQVLLETHNLNEFDIAIETDADLVGINNRDLTTLKVNISTTIEILKSRPNRNRLVVSESGIENADDIRLLKGAGADAFLVGTSIMRSSDIKSKVVELVDA